MCARFGLPCSTRETGVFPEKLKMALREVTAGHAGTLGRWAWPRPLLFYDSVTDVLCHFENNEPQGDSLLPSDQVPFKKACLKIQSQK